MAIASNWFTWALFSAVFPALSAIFAKIGLAGVDSDLATLIRTVIIFGVLGLLMKRWEFSRPSLALGYILGELCEYYFWTSLQFEGPFFFMRPISLFFIAVTAFVISYDYIKPLFRRRPKEVKKS